MSTSIEGQPIQMKSGQLAVPDRPIVPFIEGDGTGPDIWRASQRVFDAAVAKAYGGKRQIVWKEVLAGQKSFDKSGNWLPDETLDAFRELRVGIKGPLTTPVGGGIRSLNVALRQILDLFVCLRPVRYFRGVPTPVKQPELVDMVIFRENTEDTYAGIEFAGGSTESQKVLDFLVREFPKLADKVRFGTQEKVDGWQKQLESIGAPKRELKVDVGIGIKPMSYLGTERLVHSAIGYAIQNKRKSVTLVHKGNIMKFTEGGFRDWGYKVAREMFGAVEIDGGPWCKIPDGKPGAGIIIKDVIADAFLQQILNAPCGVRCGRDAEPQRRLHQRRARGVRGWHRHRAGCEYQLRNRPRDLRSHAWHGAEVRRTGQGESWLGDSFGRDDAAAHEVERGGGSRHLRHGGGDYSENCHLRFRAHDAGGK